MRPQISPNDVSELPHPRVAPNGKPPDETAPGADPPNPTATPQTALAANHGAARGARPNPTVSRPVSSRYAVPASAAIIVISHNYGCFLAECLESVLNQTAPPADVLVIDDRSADDTPEVAARFTSRGVRSHRVEFGNVHQSRRAGFEAATAEVLCFLDADDLLPPDYLASGLRAFSSPSVGVVYSDVEFFGDDSGCSQYPFEVDRASLERDNHIHAGSLVRREALRLSRAFDLDIDPLLTQGDWFLWRQVLRDGWRACKQRALYRYRRHGANWTGAMRQTCADYFDYAGLAHETITLFVPLSGRAALWPDLAAYLARQSWPHGNVRLILFDSSADDSFAAHVREWVARCDYADVRHIRAGVSRAGLADDDRFRRQIQAEVRVAMARIYNRLARDAATDYVWVLEDDILPPDDACERLLRGFDRQTASVSGTYPSRHDGLPCAWDWNLHHFSRPGIGVQPVYGNGFGCVVLRGGILRAAVFQATGDYDRVFYRQVHDAGLNAKVDWRVVCDHRRTLFPLHLGEGQGEGMGEGRGEGSSWAGFPTCSKENGLTDSEALAMQGPDP
jgi:hypothetical protein